MRGLTDPAFIEALRDFLRGSVGALGDLELADICAHKLISDQTIHVHNDYIGNEETHRALVQLNSGWGVENGGILNPVYRGMIRHKQVVHQGQHDPVVGVTLWDAAHAVLADNSVDRRTSTNVDHPSLLTGLLVDQAGRPMSPSHTCRAAKRYRCYHTSP